MASGWDAASPQIALAPPWEDFWVRVYLDPPIGDYLAMKAALIPASSATEEALDALIATIPPLLAEHNIVGRDGEPIEWKARAMGSRLITGICDAIKRVQDGKADEPADPLPQSEKPATSRPRASRANRSRRSTRSGGSR